MPYARPAIYITVSITSQYRCYDAEDIALATDQIHI
jgi:hypothetical protein